MQNQTSPLILSFGAIDPIGATDLMADMATFSAMGCRGVSAATALLLGDTTGNDDLQPVDADWVSDQARTLLEDMPVAAFKVGIAANPETITAIAEIVSDYPEIPLVLDPFSAIVRNHDDMGYEDYMGAMRDLLIPQASLLVISAAQLAQLAETWRPAMQDVLLADALQLANSGCGHVLVTDAGTTNGMITNLLFDDSGLVREDTWPRQPGSFIGAGTTLSAAIAALMAAGAPAPAACAEAQEFTNATLANAQRLGMGSLVPDHYFWTRVPDASTTPNS